MVQRSVRRSRREFFNDMQTRENRIQLQRHARRSKRQSQTHPSWFLGASGGPEVLPESIVKSTGTAAFGEEPVVAPIDHVHKHHTPLNANAAFLDLASQPGAANEYSKDLKVTPDRHLTDAQFQAPLNVGILVKDIDAFDTEAASVKLADKDGNPDGAAFEATNIGPSDAKEGDLVLFGFDENGDEFFPFGKGLIKSAVDFWIGTKSGLPPSFSEFTSGLTDRLEFKSQITTTGYRGWKNSVCDFDGIGNHPTTGFPAPASFLVVLETDSSGKALLSTLAGNATIDTSFTDLDIDIITAAMDFSVTSPKFSPIDALAGTNIKSSRFNTSFETNVATIKNNSYAVIVPAGHGIGTIHGVRIKPGAESMSSNHNTTFFQDRLSTIKIIAL